MDKSTEWGGKRKGAGRPPSATVRLKEVVIPREVWNLLEQAAHSKGISTAELAAEVLESYVTVLPTSVKKTPSSSRY